MHPEALPSAPASSTPFHSDPLSGFAPASGWPAFDEMGLVRPGRVLLLDMGSEEGHRLVMGLLAGATAGGREAVVVDGGNWLDAYRLGESAERLGLARAEALDGVRVARGFTAYQLQSLVEDALPRILAEGDGRVGLVLASCLPDMYLDDDLKRGEARVLLARAMATLRRVAEEHQVAVVVTNAVLAPSSREALRRELVEGAHDAVGLLPAPHGAVLLWMRSGAILAPGPRARIRPLEAYGAVITGARASTAGIRPPSYDPRLRHMPKRAGEMRFFARAPSPGASA